MKKTLLIVLLMLLLIVCVLWFVPIIKQQDLQINASFFNTYQQLSQPAQWKKWRQDLRQVYFADSAAVKLETANGGFTISTKTLNLNVNMKDGYSFVVNENNSGKIRNYSYTLFPLQNQDVINLTVREKVSLFKYLVGFSNNDILSGTHAIDLKKFMETSGLYYGYTIEKRKISDTTMLGLRHLVLKKDMFTEASKQLAVLRQYIGPYHFKQTQPIISEFITRNDDSVMVIVGIPINKRIPPGSKAPFMEMPQNGNSYIINFKGQFSERLKAYAALKKYFNDHHLQMATLSFETYFNNQLPLTNSDTVNIRINFPTY